MDPLAFINRAICAASSLLLLGLGHFAFGEKLPLKIYMMADGLPRDHINRIVQDSKGFLWICTTEGLSRFDGYRFTNYDQTDGLPSRAVNDFLEDHNGTDWVGTEGGLCRLNPGPLSSSEKAHRFSVFAPDDRNEDGQIKSLFEDRSHIIWCATEGGLFQLASQGDKVSFYRQDFILPAELGTRKVRAVKEDKGGSIWVAASSGLYRLRPDAKVERYTEKEGIPPANSLMADHDGRIWLSTLAGVIELVSDPIPGKRAIERMITKKDGLPTNDVFATFQSVDGNIWIGTDQGLCLLPADTPSNTPALKTFTEANGLSDQTIGCFNQDHDGNLWIGTSSGGLMRLASSGFRSYNDADGLNPLGIKALVLDRKGEMCSISNGSISSFDGVAFHTSRLNPPRGWNWDWGWNQITFQDKEGDWWVSTGSGLLRYADCVPNELTRQNPAAIYTTKNGLPSNEVFRLFEDSRGDIWISTLGNQNAVLTRWQRSTNSFHTFTPTDGVPSGAPTVFKEDYAGNLWFGTYDTGLVRYSNGKFTQFTGAGYPTGLIQDMFFDDAGRLWIATDSSGVWCSSDPDAARLSFTIYDTAQGLSSSQALCIKQDQWGMIYSGTGRGVDRIDPRTQQIKHFTTADGLASSFVYIARRMPDNSLWFATEQGLSRLQPELDASVQLPPVSIDFLRIAGVLYPLPDLGAAQLKLPHLGPNQNDLDIEFAGLSLGVGESLRYEYKLEGATDTWSQPTAQRSVNYPNLPPGTYRFLVRAVTSAGAKSLLPASVSFVILPPFWQTWWFIALVIVMIAATVYVIDRYRVARLLELERVRTRIATDLHDDIGASLSRMAILSEVVKQQTSQDGKSARMLSDIADSARGLVDSMSDIVWSIDPNKDDLTDVAMRVRAFASDLLEPKGVRWDFEMAPGLEKIKLSPDARRHIYLIFKEAISNIARHSGCTRAIIRVTVINGNLSAEISDNGKGMSESANATLGGNGLRNMKKRAQDLGGDFQIQNGAEGGTILKFTVHLK